MAGSTAVQEVAFTLADAIAYIEAAVSAGLQVDAFAPRLSFFFNVHNDFLEEIAKFRAVRRYYARMMKEQFGATRPESMRLRFHAQTAAATLTWMWAHRARRIPPSRPRRSSPRRSWRCRILSRRP